MRTEISQAKREANFYIQNVEKGKAIDAIETRKRKRDDQVQCLLRLFYLCSKKERMSEGKVHTHIMSYAGWWLKWHGIVAQEDWKGDDDDDVMVIKL